jgi:hypothetical protein
MFKKRRIKSPIPQKRKGSAIGVEKEVNKGPRILDF